MIAGAIFAILALVLYLLLSESAQRRRQRALELALRLHGDSGNDRMVVYAASYFLKFLEGIK
jgi:hypothetical protein